MRTPLVTPVVNLNGNSAESLIEQLCEVMRALRAAEEAFAKNADVTHGRNFQHLIAGRDSTKHVLTVMDAQQAWGERRLVLDAMRQEVEQLALAIQEQKEH